MLSRILREKHGSTTFPFLLFPIILKSLANAFSKKVQHLLEGRGGPRQRTNPGKVSVAFCHLGVNHSLSSTKQKVVTHRLSSRT